MKLDPWEIQVVTITTYWDQLTMHLIQHTEWQMMILHRPIKKKLFDCSSLCIGYICSTVIFKCLFKHIEWQRMVFAPPPLNRNCHTGDLPICLAREFMGGSIWHFILDFRISNPLIFNMQSQQANSFAEHLINWHFNILCFDISRISMSIYHIFFFNFL